MRPRVTRLMILTALAASACGQVRDNAAQDKDPFLMINTLLVRNACSNCHGSDYTLVGPSMVDVAGVRGPDSSEARKALAAKILDGTQRVWGTAIMPPQHQVTPDKAQELAAAILELAAPPQPSEGK
jgi:cytochrome c551/c552